MSVAGVEVRLARADDLADIVALERATAEAPHWSVAEYEAMLASGAGAVRRRLFVAAGEEGLVGFAGGKVVGTGTESFGELETVAVALGARRAGIGAKLCEAVAGWCRAQGAPAMELEVRAASAGAIALYSSLGFAEVGQRRSYYSQPSDDAVLMRLDLGACG